MADVAFSCTCGQIKGVLKNIARGSGMRAVCHCNSCRSAELFLNQPDPRPDGVQIYQTTPDRVQIDTGADQLAVLSLSDGGLLRWYAGCCRAPLFNTTRRSGMPFVGVRVERMADPAALGPVVAQGFIPGKNGTQTHKGMARLVYGVFIRAAAARLSGKWRENPFFDIGTGNPIAKPYVLTKAERAALPLRG